MWAALSTEEMGDVFEATQRSYSYTFGRPLHYAWYALVALLRLGGVRGRAVDGGTGRVHELLAGFLGCRHRARSELSRLGSAVAHLPARASSLAVTALVLTVASAFRYAFFWCAAGAIYLLLRRDSDQIEFDIVHVPDQPVRYSLPPLTTDEAGVPGV